MAVLTYKCPNCDGPLTWNGKKERFVCDYCRSMFSEAELKVLSPAAASAETVDAETARQLRENARENGASAEAFNEAEENKSTKQPAKMKLYSCPSCGAQVVTDDTTAATTCYYCHNPIVLMDKLGDEYTPDFLIPFSIDRKQAEKVFADWVKKQKYIPSDFYNAKQIELLSGVYFPYWVYSCHVHSDISGTADRIRIWEDSRMRYTETSVYDITDTAESDIRDMSRIALNKASKVLCESVMPFDTEKLKEFNPGYLQGYIAETRDIEMSQIRPEVSEEVDAYCRNQAKRKIQSGFDAVHIDSINNRVSSESFRYALLPVWTVTYKDKTGKVYYFSINGQTGKTCGELPTEGKKLMQLFFKVFIPLFVFLLVILGFLF